MGGVFGRCQAAWHSGRQGIGCSHFAADARKGLRKHLPNKTVNGAAVPEAHFMLGRVYIHVYCCRINIQEQHIGRLPVAMQDIGIGRAYGVGNGAIPYKATIHI